MSDRAAPGGRALTAWNAVLLAALSLLSAFEALVGAFYLPLWWDGRPFPVTALVCGALNVAIALAATWASPRAGLLPLAVWLLVCVVCLVPGPGGSRILLFAIADWRAPLFLAAGAIPAVVARRRLRRE
ncbi:hypothetical protein [Segniliparus rugosus]|uniref:hypothetical protein n=1 Tax=Segniliparus rugosus TaxID=286804 RepID=UPI0001F0356C|nr:hypothetical protein [Segniliparus rugosus]